MLGSTADSCSCVRLRRLVLLVTLHVALCSLPRGQAHEARYHGRYGPDRLLCASLAVACTRLVLLVSQLLHARCVQRQVPMVDDLAQNIDGCRLPVLVLRRELGRWWCFWPGLTAAIRAAKGWRGRRELVPWRSATRISCMRCVAWTDTSHIQGPNHTPPHTATHRHTATHHHTPPHTTTHHHTPPHTTTHHHFGSSRGLLRYSTAWWFLVSHFSQVETLHCVVHRSLFYAVHPGPRQIRAHVVFSDSAWACRCDVGGAVAACSFGWW